MAQKQDFSAVLQPTIDLIIIKIIALFVYEFTPSTKDGNVLLKSVWL